MGDADVDLSTGFALGEGGGEMGEDGEDLWGSLIIYRKGAGDAKGNAKKKIYSSLRSLRVLCAFAVKTKKLPVKITDSLISGDGGNRKINIPGFPGLGLSLHP